MQITGTHFNYYYVCHRKLWLFAAGVTMEHVSEAVADGRFIHENTYPQRPVRYEEIAIDGIKVDYFDPNRRVIHEIKRTNKIELAHEWQVKYYLYVFERHGITECTGLLEYPKLRKTHPVILTDADRKEILQMENEIEILVSSNQCPAPSKKSICRMCSYFDFCFVNEPEQTP